MNKEQALRIHKGDLVEVNGTPSRVESVQVRGIAAPYFRLSGTDGGPVSYLVCTSLPTHTTGGGAVLSRASRRRD